MKLEQKKPREELVEDEGSKNRTIDRKEAIKKTGYIALSAATMMLLLSNPNKANAQPSSSPGAPGPW